MASSLLSQKCTDWHGFLHNCLVESFICGNFYNYSKVMGVRSANQQILVRGRVKSIFCMTSNKKVRESSPHSSSNRHKIGSFHFIVGALNKAMTSYRSPYMDDPAKIS